MRNVFLGFVIVVFSGYVWVELFEMRIEFFDNYVWVDIVCYII